MARSPKPWFRSSRRLWFVTIDGVQYNLGPDKSAAFERFHQLMTRPKQVQVTSSESFAELADRYLDWVQKNRSPDTYEWYRYRLERFVRKYPDLKAGDLRPHHIEAWVDDYNFSVTSRRNYMRSVKRCLSWSVKQGLIAQNPAQTLEIPSGDRKEVFFTAQQVETLLEYVQNECLRDLIVTTWETGCRPQESLRVEARHVDLENSRWVIPKREAKSKRMARVIYLNERALEITNRLVERYPTRRLIRNSSGTPWTTDAVMLQSTPTFSSDHVLAVHKTQQVTKSLTAPTGSSRWPGSS